MYFDQCDWAVSIRYTEPQETTHWKWIKVCLENLLTFKTLGCHLTHPQISSGTLNGFPASPKSEPSFPKCPHAVSWHLYMRCNWFGGVLTSSCMSCSICGKSYNALLRPYLTAELLNHDSMRRWDGEDLGKNDQVYKLQVQQFIQ